MSPLPVAPALELTFHPVTGSESWVPFEYTVVSTDPIGSRPAGCVSGRVALFQSRPAVGLKLPAVRSPSISKPPTSVPVDADAEVAAMRPGTQNSTSSKLVSSAIDLRVRLRVTRT